MAGAVCDFKLSEFVVKNAPPNIVYIPHFISQAEEEYLLNQVANAPKPKWTQLMNRRLQNWGGLPHPKGMIQEKLPDWLLRYCQKISDLGVFDGKVANHVLVNEYLAGQGIMPHLDGPLYYPTVSTISLGSHTLLDFYKPLLEAPFVQSSQEETSQTQGDTVQSSSFDERYMCSILLEPRSLVLVSEDMYNTNLHGITERTSDMINDKIANLNQCEAQMGQTLDRETRVSLTIRHVPKVLKSKLFPGLMKR